MTVLAGLTAKPRSAFSIIYLDTWGRCGNPNLRFCLFPILVCISVLGSKSRTHSSLAQYFQAADQIFILGDNGIKEQGTWDTIKDKAASITKFNLEPRNKRNNILSANFDKISAQVLAKDEAEVDLSRQTGDFALYGNGLTKR